MVIKEDLAKSGQTLPMRFSEGSLYKSTAWKRSKCRFREVMYIEVYKSLLFWDASRKEAKKEPNTLPWV